MFAVVLALGQAVAARHRAGGAADLAALAAADRALQGPAAACEAAGRVAGAQEAVVVRCAVQGEIADVTARARFGPYEPEVRARAGPPDEAARAGGARAGGAAARAGGAARGGGSAATASACLPGVGQGQGQPGPGVRCVGVR
ncbi:Rv3654c family TadE-like protein [Streptomyces finlayi]|uniref:Rv3654c family TadE-like protein n=1 Tax=Streptomyces finlayi TaxID=67296 RepID=UPI0035BC8797